MMKAKPFQVLSRTTRWWRALPVALGLVLCAAGLRAAPLLTVTGAGDLGHTINSNQAAAVSFTLTQAFTGISATADLTGVNARGGAFLMSNLGPLATVADIVASVDLASIVFAGADTLLFSGLDLGPGDYAILVASDQSFQSSTVIWNGSRVPNVTAGLGIIDGIDFFSASTAAGPWSSSFTTVFDRSGHFMLSVATQGVPEPSTWLLVVLASAGLVVVQVRRRPRR